MHCPNCGAQNEPEARFCAECGTPLEDHQLDVTLEGDVSPAEPDDPEATIVSIPPDPAAEAKTLTLDQAQEQTPPSFPAAATDEEDGQNEKDDHADDRTILSGSLFESEPPPPTSPEPPPVPVTPAGAAPEPPGSPPVEEPEPPPAPIAGEVESPPPAAPAEGGGRNRPLLIGGGLALLLLCCCCFLSVTIGAALGSDLDLLEDIMRELTLGFSSFVV